MLGRQVAPLPPVGTGWGPPCILAESLQGMTGLEGSGADFSKQQGTVLAGYRSAALRTNRWVLIPRTPDV